MTRWRIGLALLGAVLVTAAVLAVASPASSAQSGNTRRRTSPTTVAPTTTTSTSTVAPPTSVPTPAPVASTQAAFGLNSESRVDPASRRLQLIVIGLLILAVVIALGTLVFWHVTRPVVPVLGADVTVTEEHAPSPTR